MEYTETHDKFVCRTIQKAEFLWSLTKSRSIEDTDFDPEDDIQLVRIPTIDLDSDGDDPLADLMRACADEIGMNEYVGIETEIVFVESVTDDQMQIIFLITYIV